MLGYDDQFFWHPAATHCLVVYGGCILRPGHLRKRVAYLTLQSTVILFQGPGRGLRGLFIRHKVTWSSGSTGLSISPARLVAPCWTLDREGLRSRGEREGESELCTPENGRKHAAFAWSCPFPLTGEKKVEIVIVLYHCNNRLFDGIHLTWLSWFVTVTAYPKGPGQVTSVCLFHFLFDNATTLRIFSPYNPTLNPQAKGNYYETA